jgi:two-component system sensor histidine kinase PrrB
VKLSLRFALCVAALVPTLVALSGLLVLRLAVNDLHAERDKGLVIRAQALAQMSTNYAQRVRRSPSAPGGAVKQRLITAGLGDAGPGGISVEPRRGEPLVVGNVPPSLPDPAYKPATTADGDWRYVSKDLGSAGGAGRLWIFMPESELSDHVARLRDRLLAATLVAVFAGAAAGFGLGRFAVRPLSRLSAQAAGIDVRGGRLSTSSQVTEIDDLAGLVNDLLDRKDVAVSRTGEALETARAFAATAAHELRTPLTSMSTNIGLLSHPGLSEVDREAVLADLAAEHARMQRLITMLRQLARGELFDPGSFAEVDLTGLAGAAAEDARRRHPHAKIVAELDDQVTVWGWAEGLRMIVDNLLDNGAVHGTIGGKARIELTLARTASAAVLTVGDFGPGIRADLRVFDRFSRRPDSPGSGLGLTLIHQQVVLHAGVVTVETAEHAGCSVRVELPLAASAGGTGPTLSWLTKHL